MSANDHSNTVWYIILARTNIVSKSFQGKNTDINISSNTLQSNSDFFKSYINSEFNNAKTIANELDKKVRIESKFMKSN